MSGTLSYIFNSFTGEKPFSEVVKEAKNRGFTEPDPRDDLNGLDVARKLLILAREIGLQIEINQIEVESLVPDKALTGSVEDFFASIKEMDSKFEHLLSSSKENNEKLCYVASLQEGKASVSLKSLNSGHPFFSLSGADNIVSFKTFRYSERPLVVKGPGAGAEVTAAGIFSDIIRIGNRIQS